MTDNHTDRRGAVHTFDKFGSIPDDSSLYVGIYWAVNRVLDGFLGPDVKDGNGGGLVDDVALLGRQRDQARAEVVRLSERLVEAEARLNEAIDARAESQREHVVAAIHGKLTAALDESAFPDAEIRRLADVVDVMYRMTTDERERTVEYLQHRWGDA
jgi:hypothetical protein